MGVASEGDQARCETQGRGRGVAMGAASEEGQAMQEDDYCYRGGNIYACETASKVTFAEHF